MKFSTWLAQQALHRFGIHVQREPPRMVNRRDLDDFPELVVREWSHGTFDHEVRLRAHRFVTELNPTPPPPATQDPIPRRIWVYWGQGWGSAPPVVAACRRHIEAQADGMDAAFISDTELAELVDIPGAVHDNLRSERTKFSNVARCALLAEHGGVWLDATCLPTRPLRELHAFARGEFLSYTAKDDLVTSWMMIAPKGHVIPTMLRDVQVAWWTNTTEVPAYFWFRHLFEALLHRVPQFRAGWEARSPLFGGALLLLLRLDQPYDERAMAAIRDRTFIQKLTYKWDSIQHPRPGSFAEAILSGPNTPS